MDFLKDFDILPESLGTKMRAFVYIVILIHFFFAVCFAMYWGRQEYYGRYYNFNQKVRGQGKRYKIM